MTKSPHRVTRAAGALIMLVVSMTVVAQQQDDATPPSNWVIIHCGYLLDMPSPTATPRRHATLIVRDDRVHGVRDGFVDASDLREIEDRDETRTVDLRDQFVLPGLIDCHTHITGELSPDSQIRRTTETEADQAIRAVVYAKRTLNAGFTTIRNVGSLGDTAFALRDAIDEGLIDGPRILVAGRAITPTGGHGDLTHGLREDMYIMPGSREGVADGTAACRQAVRAQVKRGADVIKLTATGGVLSATNAGTGQQFFEDELEAIVETAHLLGRTVAAHAHGADGIKAALRAGVDSIEHGSFLDDEAVALFRETGAYLVPTLLAGATVVAQADELPPVIGAKARQVGPAIQDAVRRAHEAGVKIAFGTDSGVSAHGLNGKEFALMVQAGMTPMEAITAATVSASKLLKLDETIGTLQPGKYADVIAVDGDPREDVTVLERVVYVMRNGQTVKDGRNAP